MPGGESFFRGVELKMLNKLHRNAYRSLLAPSTHSQSRHGTESERVGQPEVVDFRTTPWRV